MKSLTGEADCITVHKTTALNRVCQEVLNPGNVGVSRVCRSKGKRNHRNSCTLVDKVVSHRPIGEQF